MEATNDGTSRKPGAGLLGWGFLLLRSALLRSRSVAASALQSNTSSMYAEKPRVVPFLNRNMTSLKSAKIVNIFVIQNKRDIIPKYFVRIRMMGLIANRRWNRWISRYNMHNSDETGGLPQDFSSWYYCQTSENYSLFYWHHPQTIPCCQFPIYWLLTLHIRWWWWWRFVVRHLQNTVDKNNGALWQLIKELIKSYSWNRWDFSRRQNAYRHSTVDEPKLRR